MNNPIEKSRFLNHKMFHLTIPLVTILLLSFFSGFFEIDPEIINRDRLWDIGGRPYKVFLSDLNLPHSLGAIFLSGNSDNLEKIEKYYGKAELGHIFTSQIRSFLFGTKITPTSIAFHISLLFGVSAIVFSLLVGYFVFRNGYSSIVVFLLLVLFKQLSPGLIYGLPYKYTYAVFAPLLVFSLIVFIILFLRNRSKVFWVIFVICGFIIAYIGHCRTSEKYIIVSSLIVFAIVMFIERLRINRKDIKKILMAIIILFTTMYAGNFGYQQMVKGFELHRNSKFNFHPSDENMLSAHPIFHNAFLSLFRYIPNQFNYVYRDMTGISAVYKQYPELEKKYSTDYFKLQNSKDYNTAIKRLYFAFVLNNKKYVVTNLIRSIYDYILFLPYYTWSGNKSAHAYLPKINNNVEIEPEDLAPDFMALPDNWILNLKIKYLPDSIFFWIYFVCAYILLIEAIYTSAINLKRTYNESISVREGIEKKMSIYLLWGMLIYFSFASIVRIIIPTYGHSAVVAFNVLIIFNLVRIMVSARSIKIRNTEISLWHIMLGILLLITIVLSVNNWWEKSVITVNNLKGRTNNSLSSIVVGGQKGKCLQIMALDNSPGYSYLTVLIEAGRTYEVSVFYKKGVGIKEPTNVSNGQIKVGYSIDDTALYYSGVLSDSNWTRYGGAFKANSPYIIITLVNLALLKGQASLFDGVMLKDIETGNIVFQLDFDNMSEYIMTQ